MKPLGLYLHIPFCRSKCLYCDFCSYPHRDGETIEAYVNALCRDLESRAADCSEYRVDTVYFGGGTPTMLTAEQLERLLERIFRHYHVGENAEISAECNPATASAETFRRMRRAGFNRLSIGAQSAQPNELRALGRLHAFEDVCTTFEEATQTGFSNVSIDVMFGIPHQTTASFADTLEKVCALYPMHLSAYALTVEAGTPFGKRGEAGLDLPDEDSVCRMYTEMISILESNGLVQYEISNFARPGYESRHNLKYWNMEEYLGLGPAAHSDFGGVRFGNERNMEAYLKGECLLSERSVPSGEERMNEYVMLQMRLRNGISVDDLSDRFGREAAQRFGKALERYVPGGFVHRTENRYAFTPAGMLISNSILSDILDF